MKKITSEHVQLPKCYYIAFVKGIYAKRILLSAGFATGAELKTRMKDLESTEGSDEPDNYDFDMPRLRPQ